MGAREDLLEAARRLTRDGRTSFSMKELIVAAREGGSGYPETTLRTHIAGPMCLNSPDNHAVQYGDLVRVERGRYRLATAQDLRDDPEVDQSAMTDAAHDDAEGTADDDAGPPGRPDLVARFLDDPSRPRVLDYVAHYLTIVADDPVSLLGERIGVTVLANNDRDALARINAGWQLASQVRRNGSALEVTVYLAGESGDDDLETIRATVDGVLDDGFTRVTPNRQLVFTGLDRAHQLLDDPTGAARCRDFVQDVTRRKLSQPNWHNPAIDDLLIPLLGHSP